MFICCICNTALYVCVCVCTFHAWVSCICILPYPPCMFVQTNLCFNLILLTLLCYLLKFNVGGSFSAPQLKVQPEISHIFQNSTSMTS